MDSTGPNAHPSVRVHVPAEPRSSRPRIPGSSLARAARAVHSAFFLSELRGWFLALVPLLFAPQFC